MIYNVLLLDLPYHYEQLPADEEYSSYAEYPPEEDPQACWQAPPFQEDQDDQPCYSVMEEITPPLPAYTVTPLFSPITSFTPI
jgi:hypothetical protein